MFSIMVERSNMYINETNGTVSIFYINNTLYMAACMLSKQDMTAFMTSDS